MNIFQIREYAEEIGFDSVEFIIKNPKGDEFKGRFLDAYFGLVLIPELGDGFINLTKLQREYGNDFFEFIPTKEGIK
jgi:sugar phosphate isomerase/epimerase